MEKGYPFIKWESWYLIPLVTVAYFSFLYRHYQLDDALIYLRYIRNFHEGLGLVYNPGQRFNGLTSPLFTWLMVILTFFIRNYQLANVLLSGLFFYFSIILGVGLVSSQKPVQLITAVFISLTQYFYTTFGMDTCLFLLLIMCSLHLYKKGSDYFVLALSLLAVTRIEGGLLGLVLLISYIIEKGSIPPWPLLLGAAMIFLAPFVFNELYYGQPLPATIAAKWGQGRSGLWGRLIFINLLALARNFFIAPWLLISSIPLILYGIFLSRSHPLIKKVILFLLILFLLYSAFNLPNYHWYYAPFVFFSLIFFSIGLAGIASRRFEHSALSFSLLIIALVALLVSNRDKLEYRQKDYDLIADWVKQYTEGDSDIAMVEVGTIGWYSNRKIVDILGLVTPYNAGFIGQRKFHRWLTIYQPDYILVHNQLWSQEASVDFLIRTKLYIDDPDFSIRGYRLLEKAKNTDNQMIVALINKNFRNE